MTVWVVWDPLYERVVSVHSTATGAEAAIAALDEQELAEGRGPRDAAYMLHWEKFEVQEYGVVAA